MRVGIMTGGNVDVAFVRKYSSEKPVDFWIGVDHGMEALYELGILPCCIVGDFDSVDPKVLRYYRSQEGIDWHEFCPVKDDTDTELAIRQAIGQRPDQIVIFGGTGTRLDHVLGTIHVMKKALDQGIHCEMADPHNRIYLLRGEKQFRKEELFGPYISFLPFGGAVHGLTLRGFRYPLEQRTVEPGSSLTISNELAESEALFQLTEGVVICVEARD